LNESDVLDGKRALVDRYFPVARAFMAGWVAPSRVAAYAPASNIVGVGVAEKVTDNELTGILSVRIYVREKAGQRKLSRRERLPSTVAGVPVDVVQAGHIEARKQRSDSRRRRIRPVPGGVSCGHDRGTAGTAGCLVRDRKGQGLFILSNNHVLAQCNEASPGDSILQPGPMDGGTSQDRIGGLSRFLPLNLGEGINDWDAALVEVRQEEATPEILLLEALRGQLRPKRDMVVIKHGRTTGKTQGLVEDVNADIWVDYANHGYGRFRDTVVIRGSGMTPRFSEAGDSGALIVAETCHKACALLFAGSPVLTFANPLAPILRALRVQLVT